MSLGFLSFNQYFFFTRIQTERTDNTVTEKAHSHNHISYINSYQSLIV